MQKEKVQCSSKLQSSINLPLVEARLNNLKSQKSKIKDKSQKSKILIFLQLRPGLKNERPGL